MNTVPPWLKKRITFNNAYFETKRAIADSLVNTVCESSMCPNLNECFSRKKATFMILGKSCTRSCAFCSVTKGRGAEVDIEEPNHISECVKRLGLKYIIITSVTRDDLEDGGAEQFVRTVAVIRRVLKEAIIELLIPDFAGKRESLEVVVASGADIIGHNIETVKRLYPAVRNGASYSRSVDVLRFIKESNPKQITKSAILAGMGETGEEVVKTMQDLRMAGCDILTIGQYLSPSEYHYQIQKFVTPDEFARYKRIGEDLGFRNVSSGPFVRSSYCAEEAFPAVSYKL